MFPKNTWYVGATPSELDGKPLGRKICGESIVFFRGPDNKVAAVEDFCPHRGAPLSLGKVENGKLVCGYHGLEMGCDGKTVAMPCQRVGGFPAVRTYPVVERYGFIWVWPGDAQEADPSKIHHLAWADDPEIACVVLRGNGAKAPQKPWDGAEGLEWEVPSPAPFHTFENPPKLDATATRVIG